MFHSFESSKALTPSIGMVSPVQSSKAIAPGYISIPSPFRVRQPIVLASLESVFLFRGINQIKTREFLYGETEDQLASTLFAPMPIFGTIKRCRIF